MKIDRQAVSSARFLHRNGDSRGFTLVELLVVVAIISVLAGGVGLYRMNQASSNRINAAARMVSAVMTRARTQALVSGNQTRVLVDLEASSHSYLKQLFVCELRDGDWRIVGGAADLPNGIAVVPNDSRQLMGDWADASSVFSDGSSRMSLDPDGRGNRQYAYIQFSPSGGMEMFEESDYLRSDVDVGEQIPRIFLSTVTRTGPSEWVFDHPELRVAVFLTINGDTMVMGN